MGERGSLHAEEQRVDQEKADAQHGTQTPVAEVRALLARGAHDPQRIAAVIVAHPEARGPIYEVLHQTLGNRFVTEVDGYVATPVATSIGLASPRAAVGPEQPPLVGSPHEKAEISGPLPPGSAGDSASRTTSELAFASGRSAAASPAQKHTDDVARTDYIYETAQKASTGILGSLVPGYRAARDQRDISAVAELGGSIIAAFSLVHGAKSALDEMLRRVQRKSVQGLSADGDLEAAKTQQALDAKAPLLTSLIAVVDGMVATTITPHEFHGKEVAGTPIVVALGGHGAEPVNKLVGELQRTLGMLVLADDLRAMQLGGKHGLDQSKLAAARLKLAPWATRPLDLAFLRAVLGPTWELLDATSTGPMDAKPSDLLAHATSQAKHTGWLGDVGRFDIGNAASHLRAGGREMAELVLSDLYTTDPDTRARGLIQIKEHGLLDALCSAVGWADIKQLHDSLGGGFAEIKTDLQHYFLGKGKYGPSMGSEWENHDSSLHSLVGRLGIPGKVLNFALDVGTFGFNSSYGKAIDDRSEGLTSESSASRAKMNAAGRTAVIAAVSILTGGLADKYVRGGAATVSTMRGVGAGAAGGSAGAVSGLAASDVYGNASGEQHGFSSPEDYVKALLLGGGVGGAIGGVTQGLSNRVSSKYLPEAALAGEVGEGTMYKVSSNGLRNEEPLTPQQVNEAVGYAKELGVPEEVINVTENGNTSWGDLFGTERLNIGTDVLPSTNPRIAAKSANSRVSGKGAVAHEVVGHRAAARAGRTQDIPVLEEAQASIRAARFAPGLTAIERLTLIRDAVERLHKAGLRVSDVRQNLWIEEP